MKILFDFGAGFLQLNLFAPNFPACQSLELQTTEEEQPHRNTSFPGFIGAIKTRPYLSMSNKGTRRKVNDQIKDFHSTCVHVHVCTLPMAEQLTPC